MAIKHGIDENNNTAPGEIIRQWLKDIYKSLDFIFVNQPQELSVWEALLGNNNFKIYDPYRGISEPPLNKKIDVINAELSRPGKLSGFCYVKLTNGEEIRGMWRGGRREGAGSLFGPRLEKVGVHHISGYYNDGILSGQGKIYMLNSTIREGWFHHGYFHGPCRGITFDGQVNYVGWYKSGVATGPTWMAVRGDGWLFGELDEQGQFTGSNIAYLYPDLSTAILGRFEQGELVSGQPALVTWTSYTDGVLIPHFTTISDKDEYKRWISTNKELVCPLHLPDPYEARVVQVQGSSIQGAGEGLFAKVDLPADSIICYYNGLRLGPGENLEDETGYAIFLENNLRKDENAKHLDIPRQYHSSLCYSATLGHKINHSFSPNCRWDNAEHPVHGLVPAVRTIEAVSAGAELTIHYMLDMEDSFDWYKEEWEAHGRRLLQL